LIFGCYIESHHNKDADRVLVGIHYLIECGLAGGDWEEYILVPEEFASDITINIDF
jgi:hypothetical protein